MGREIYNIINDMAEVLNASQMQRLQEVLVKRLSENAGYNKYSGDKDYNGNAAKISCGVSSNK